MLRRERERWGRDLEHDGACQLHIDEWPRRSGLVIMAVTLTDDPQLPLDSCLLRDFLAGDGESTTTAVR
ncbi:hypothetical protein GCM10009611_26540 [Arthrobacter roseus]